MRMQPERSTDAASKRVSGRRWAAIGAVALAAVLVAGVLVALASLAALRDEPEVLGFEPSPTPSAEQPTPTPSAEPTPEPTATPTPAAAASAAPSPTPEPPAAETVVLEPVSFALNTVDRLSLRAEPGLDGERLGSLSADSVSVVLDGPLSADGYSWYQLSGLGMPPYTECTGPGAGPPDTDPWPQAPLSAPTSGCPKWLGWVAAGSLDGEQWLVPVSREEVGCPSSPLSIDDFRMLGSMQPLGCFAGDDITVRGWYPNVRDPHWVCGLFGPDELTWLACFSGVTLSSEPTDDDWGPLTLKIDPASGVTMPQRGQWLEVTGFYDHPLARRCGDANPSLGYVPDAAEAAYATRECRSQFVVSDVRVVAGP
jgi:hypothetical protein